MKGEQTRSFDAEALLRLQDKAFVRQAYAALLGLGVAQSWRTNMDLIR